jgi:c-di-AMP phosphodiesterase-like protein
METKKQKDGIKNFIIVLGILTLLAYIMSFFSGWIIAAICWIVILGIMIYGDYLYKKENG